MRVMALTASILLAGSASLAEGSTEPLAWDDLPGPVDLVCPFRSEIDYEPGEIECGFITVPENRSDPDSRLIRLHYVRIAATGDPDAEDGAEEAPRDDPIIYLTGGPGVGVGPYVDRLREHEVVRHRDLYILEQRGIGTSGDFCPHFDDTNRAALWTENLYEAEVEAAERMRACFRAAAAAGIDVSGYNTVENARDVRALREALGLEQWNVWGISYGSHLGQMLLREDPDGVRAIVLDAIVPNNIGELMRIGRWASLVFENIFSTCDDASVCDDLQARFDAALAKAKAEPVIVETDNTELFPAGKVRFGGEILAFAPFMMMYEQDGHPGIPAVMDTLIRAIDTRDMTVYELLASDDGGPDGIPISLGMATAIRCNDGYFAAEARVAASDLEENPRFRDLVYTPEGAAYQARVCEEEGLGPRDRDAYALIETNVPALIVNGGWDPVTPPAMAQAIAPGFANGRYIEVPYAGHGPTRSMSECAGGVLTAFFDNPDPAALDAACLEEGVARPEYLDLFQTSALRRAGIMAADDPKRLAVPGAWAGVSLLVLLVAFFAFPLGWLTRAIDRRRGGVDPGGQAAGVRGLAWVAALSGLGFAGLMGLAGYQASEVSEFTLLAGLAPLATSAAWLSLLAGLLGVAAIVAVWRARSAPGGVRSGTFAGVFLTGLAALSLAIFALAWDLGPF